MSILENMYIWNKNTTFHIHPIRLICILSSSCTSSIELTRKITMLRKIFKLDDDVIVERKCKTTKTWREECVDKTFAPLQLTGEGVSIETRSSPYHVNPDLKMER